MDDLIAYIISLFNTDTTATGCLLPIFQAAGVPTLTAAILAPKQRTNAVYPRVIVYGYEGKQISYSENRGNKFERGILKVEIGSKRSEADPDALSTLVAIKKRCRNLLLGNYYAIPRIPSTQGVQISSSYRVDSFVETTPTGYVDTDDPTFERWEGSYAVLLNRIGS